MELGAAHIVPFFSRYCVAAPKKEEQKNERYNRIALEAAKQCGRGVLPNVALPLPNFGAVCRSFDQYDLVLFCYECGGAPLRDLLAAAKPADGEKLKIAIDRLIPISKDLDDLLRRLEAEGYEIKRGKYISFRAPGQERFTRAKTLGETYTEEAIAERIKGKVILKTPKPERSDVSLLIDIENCIKAQQSAGYERWAKIENLKRAARTMVFLDQHGISHYTDLEQKITVLQDSNEQTAAALKAAERRLSDLALLIKHTATYKELKPLYSEYKKSRDKEKYLREEYSRLSKEKDRLYAEYGSLKKRMREYDAVKQNIDSILSPNRGQEQDKAL